MLIFEPASIEVLTFFSYKGHRTTGESSTHGSCKSVVKRVNLKPRSVLFLFSALECPSKPQARWVTGFSLKQQERYPKAAGHPWLTPRSRPRANLAATGPVSRLVFLFLLG